MSILHAVAHHARRALGLDWLAEAREIAEDARRQRLEDERNAASDPHDMARWFKEPRDYRRPAPGEGRRHETK